jgi:hypothetical protein
VVGQLDDAALDVGVGALQSAVVRGVERLEESRMLHGRRRTEVLNSPVRAITELV